MPRQKVTKTTPKKEVKKTTPRKATKQAEVVSKPVASESTTNTTSVRNPRLWIGLAVVLLAVLLYAYKGLFIAASVNGQPISRIAVIQSLEKQGGKQAVSGLITQQLIMQEAAKKNITVSQADVDGEIKKIQDSLKGQGATLDQALAARGLTKDDLVQQIRLQKMLEKMVGTEVNVTDQEVQDYIDKNQDSLPKDVSDDQLKAQVKQQLVQQKLQDKTQAFVDNLQKNAKVEYYVNY